MRLRATRKMEPESSRVMVGSDAVKQNASPRVDQKIKS